MKKMTILFVMVMTLISCATTGNIQTEKPEIKNNDGSFIIRNKDSQGNSFLTGDIYIANNLPYDDYRYYNKDIWFLIYGFSDVNGNKEILQTKIAIENAHSDDEFILEYFVKDVQSKSFKKQNTNISFSDFDTIAVFTVNGKLTDAEVEVKNGNLYITIKKYDFGTLSSLVEKFMKEGEEKQEAKKKASQEAYSKFCSAVYEQGEKLFAEKIMPLQDKNIPIFINSYDISKDSADGIEVSINFENIYNKTIKYVDFEVTPYNRVNDVAYSTIDGVSTKVIQAVDFIAPNESYKAQWKPIWYNPTISYIKINSIKVTFLDNTTISVPKSNIEKVFTKRELIKEVYRNGKRYILLKYDVAENEFYAEYNLNESMFMSSIFDYQIYFDTEAYYVNNKFVTSYHQQATGDYTTGLLKLSLDSNYLNFQLINSAKSGEIRTESRGATPGSELSVETIYKFSKDDLKFIKECVCMCYYRNLSK